MRFTFTNEKFYFVMLQSIFVNLLHRNYTKIRDIDN